MGTGTIFFGKGLSNLYSFPLKIHHSICGEFVYMAKKIMTQTVGFLSLSPFTFLPFTLASDPHKL